MTLTKPSPGRAIRTNGYIIGYRKMINGYTWSAQYRNGHDLGLHNSKHAATLAVFNHYELSGAPYDIAKRLDE